MSDNHTEKQAIRQLAPNVFSFYKMKGETLSVLVDRFRQEKNIASDVPVTYAGRLDPMAEGIMVLLVGEACKQKDDWLLRDKVYECEIAFGIATDTYDMLGLITEYAPRELSLEKVHDATRKLVGKQSLPYPPYSSKPVDGIPLFQRARSGMLPAVLPTKEGVVYSFEIYSFEEKPLNILSAQAVTIIKKVAGDFRQEDIIKQWEHYSTDTTLLKTIRVRCTVSSGIYVRSLAVQLGKVLGTPAVVIGINRVAIQ